MLCSFWSLWRIFHFIKYYDNKNFKIFITFCWKCCHRGRQNVHKTLSKWISSLPVSLFTFSHYGRSLVSRVMSSLSMMSPAVYSASLSVPTGTTYSIRNFNYTYLSTSAFILVNWSICRSGKATLWIFMNFKVSLIFQFKSISFSDILTNHAFLNKHVKIVTSTNSEVMLPAIVQCARF